MRSIALLSTLFAATCLVHAQGGSGAPSPVGQAISPQAASAAERAVESRHENALARSKARAAKRAAKSASSNND
jgi:hypothetical protein